MKEFITALLANFRWSTIPDFIIVYIIIYYFLLWTKATKAINLVRGMIFIFVVYFASFVLKLTTLNWLLGKFTTVLILLVIIIFQPELRRILDKVGRGRLFGPLLSTELQGPVIIKQILKAVDQLSQKKIGALIAIEISSNLGEYIESGLEVNALLTSDLLINLFWPLTPTHDGAVVIRNNRILAAGCLLPLTDTKVADRRLGTRHRAAIGLSEETDAIVIVISEETGIMSLAENGNLTRFLTKEALETRLFNLYSEETPAERKLSMKDVFGYFLKKQ
ncbi:diadenylate cyclase CdaA [Candidatus Margulisiibacteriota bacterium]